MNKYPDLETMGIDSSRYDRVVHDPEVEVSLYMQKLPEPFTTKSPTDKKGNAAASGTIFIKIYKNADPVEAAGRVKATPSGWEFFLHFEDERGQIEWFQDMYNTPWIRAWLVRFFRAGDIGVFSRLEKPQRGLWFLAADDDRENPTVRFLDNGDVRWPDISEQLFRNGMTRWAATGWPFL